MSAFYMAFANVVFRTCLMIYNDNFKQQRSLHQPLSGRYQGFLPEYGPQYPYDPSNSEGAAWPSKNQYDDIPSVSYDFSPYESFLKPNYGRRRGGDNKHRDGSIENVVFDCNELTSNEIFDMCRDFGNDVCEYLIRCHYSLNQPPRMRSSGYHPRYRHQQPGNRRGKNVRQFGGGDEFINNPFKNGKSHDAFEYEILFQLTKPGADHLKAMKTFVNGLMDIALDGAAVRYNFIDHPSAEESDKRFKEYLRNEGVEFFKNHGNQQGKMAIDLIHKYAQ